MLANPAAELCFGHHRQVVGHPTQQPGTAAKGQILRQQTNPFLQTSGRHLPRVRRQAGIAGQDMALRAGQVADLAGELHHTQPTDHFQRVVPVATRRSSLILPKAGHQLLIGQAPLLHQQLPHGCPPNFQHRLFDPIQVLLRFQSCQLDCGHGLSPDFGQLSRLVQILNPGYHHYQLAHVNLPMIASRRCRDIEDIP